MKGILFKPDLIPRIVDGTKTHTRRAEACLKVINEDPDDWIIHAHPFESVWLFCKRNDPEYIITVKPRYKLEEVYIKETWAVHFMYDDLPPRDLNIMNGWVKGNSQWYKEYGLEPVCGLCVASQKGKWRSPLFMPEMASWYHIEVLSNMPKRLQDMGPLDALQEGFPKYHEYDNAGDCIKTLSPMERFIDTWDSINPDHKWAKNDWVIDYGFELLMVEM